MREIKFRGMALNGQWFYGNLAIIPNDIKTAGVKAGYYISNRAGFPFAYPVRPETVGQYTGLKDRNGTEIFEGDLLFDKDELTRPFIVKWDDEWAQFYVDCGGGSTDFLWKWANLEVIGNIYANPELLEGGT
jgi:hypothetical protein